ncbi:hypothetical protein [Micromonospora sp. CNB394]|uniref:hypothetical protein n=1 Tax=Micromonospora sp. CNB394 TaxID=1169151 RepID=UPI000364C777|nr:hypothetical protein [Micromonospora sp. CNB394]
MEDAPRHPLRRGYRVTDRDEVLVRHGDRELRVQGANLRVGEGPVRDDVRDRRPVHLDLVVVAAELDEPVHDVVEQDVEHASVVRPDAMSYAVTARAYGWRRCRQARRESWLSLRQ